MRTRVIRIGFAVPGAFHGVVRAVWHRTVAVALRDEEGPALVSLVRADVPMTAASMALDVSPRLDFDRWGIRAGDRVRFDGCELRISLPRAGRSLSADARFAGRYDGRLAAGGSGVAASTLDWIEGAARVRRDATCRRSALARAASLKTDRLLSGLGRAVAAGDPGAAERAARSLVGLGPGLTPAGDDALCGFMLGCRVARIESGDAEEAVAHVASTSLGHTSDVSAVQLGLAADSLFGEALLGVAQALGPGGTPGVGASTRECLDQGATSGADALLGMVAGIRAGMAAPSASCAR